MPRVNQYHFDGRAADDACAFFSRFLTHVKGEQAGQPLALADWQRDQVVRPLWGEKRADGTRRYRSAYLELPRKNGKSTLCAGLALLLLFGDREPGGEIYSVAADKDQASIVFEIAKGMIRNSALLSARCEIFKHAVVVPQFGGVYRVLSSDVATKHGLSPSGIIVDEVHALPNRDLWDVLTTGVGARRQPLTLAITTAGYDRHSLCWALHDHAVKVRDGVIEDPSHLPLIYAADETDDWKKEKTWKKANPGYGVSVKRDYLAEQAARAAESPAAENTFRRLHLNQWTEQDVRWLSLDRWDECADESPDLTGRQCYGGLDLASTTDVAALALLFPPRDDGDRHDVLMRFWVPQDNARERSRRDRVPYVEWIAEGLITGTPGNVIDFDCIRRDIVALHAVYEIREIARDPWNATQISTQLSGDGLEMVSFGQGFGAMTAPTKALEALILGRRLRHGGNKVLRWMASNVAVEQDAAGNVKPSKKRSTEKIDGIVALIMALGRATLGADGGSIYEQGGIRFV